jgi:hypothetical protein
MSHLRPTTVAAAVVEHTPPDLAQAGTSGAIKRPELAHARSHDQLRGCGAGQECSVGVELKRS